MLAMLREALRTIGGLEVSVYFVTNVMEPSHSCRRLVKSGDR